MLELNCQCDGTRCYTPLICAKLNDKADVGVCREPPTSMTAMPTLAVAERATVSLALALVVVGVVVVNQFA